MGRRALALLLVVTTAAAFAQRPVGIAYYDLDHFYDTVPSPFYNDVDNTPDGKRHWNTERYNRKVGNTAAVIDSMGLPLVALWSVENEAVVRDIAAACQGGYSYIHRTLNSLTGMDFALLYYGDAFFPSRVEQGRRYLYVEGAMGRDTVGLVLCSDVRMATWVVRDLRAERPGVKLLVLGRSAPRELAAYGLQNSHARAEGQGRGNVRRGAGWQMRDRILADTTLSVRSGDVFARRYLIDPKSGYPLPTYDRKRYCGGYGYALPVFVYIE